MILYGVNPVREALRGPRRGASGSGRPGGLERAPVTQATPEQIAAPLRLGRPPGRRARRSRSTATPTPRALLARPDPFLVALDEVTDPQNLGAVCRTAEVAGATGVILPERRSAEVTPAVCKASAGAVEHLRDRPGPQPRRLPRRGQGRGCWCYGAAAGARTPYRAPDYRGGVVLVLGAEGKGLRPRVRDACDDLVALPVRGRIDSLNVSAAAAVLMYEILQQRLDTST